MPYNAKSLREHALIAHILLTILLIVFYLLLPIKDFKSQSLNFKLLGHTECAILSPHIFEKPEVLCEPPTWEEIIDAYVDGACKNYPNVPPALIKSIIYYESRYQPNVSNGSCVGLMQISTRWHADRAERLGVVDMYDPKGNILVGVDYVNDLIEAYGDIYVVLMTYNGDNNVSRYYTEGHISSYARSVVSRQQELEVNALATKEG